MIMRGQLCNLTYPTQPQPRAYEVMLEFSVHVLFTLVLQDEADGPEMYAV